MNDFLKYKISLAFLQSVSHRKKKTWEILMFQKFVQIQVIQTFFNASDEEERLCCYSCLTVSNNRRVLTRFDG